ncbi:c-type cytochrome [Mongoliimonas terrestris]|uniref:c-type cytochrome n=1 Tax=Mongoliimonas terrestris TaxID=1709001 RepID=UPI000949A22E|nr:hypothetical protein [Mongoliimonas terrestris]
MTGQPAKRGVAAVLGAALLTMPAAAADDLRIAYLAATCAGCHAPRADAPADPAADSPMPALAGRPADDTLAALKAYRDGQRPSAVMAAAVAGLDDATLAALARHLEATSPPNRPNASGQPGAAP